MSKTKICTTCNKRKPLVEFVRRKGTPDGYACICRVCIGNKNRATRALPKAEKQVKPKRVSLDDRRCTCQPHRVGEFIAHDAGCMIFAHNQLDPHRKQQNTLEPVPQPFGTRRMWR